MPNGQREARRRSQARKARQSPHGGTSTSSDASQRPKSYASTRRMVIQAGVAGGLLLTIAGFMVVSSLDNAGPSQSYTQKTTPIAAQVSSARAVFTPAAFRPTDIIDVDQIKPASFGPLWDLPAEQRAKVDLARMNLILAKGAPDARAIDIDKCLSTLDQWAARVAAETDRYWHLFLQNPMEYQSSEGMFRIMMLVTVLQQDLGVKYNPQRVSAPDFTISKDSFIHGMIAGHNIDGSGNATGGTCISMPVLYTAIARRLGYPVHLVTTKAHVFCRWDGQYRGRTERFNIEASGVGMDTFPDEHYKAWPFEITDAEVARNRFLQNLSNDESLALFVTAAGHMMADLGSPSEASKIYNLATILAPDNPIYRGFMASTHSAAIAEQIYQDRLGARQERIEQERQAMLRKSGLYMTVAEVNAMNRQRLEADAPTPDSPQIPTDPHTPGPVTP